MPPVTGAKIKNAPTTARQNSQAAITSRMPMEQADRSSYIAHLDSCSSRLWPRPVRHPIYSGEAAAAAHAWFILPREKNFPEAE
jgi:hypothetical protein